MLVYSLMSNAMARITNIMNIDPAKQNNLPSELTCLIRFFISFLFDLAQYH